MSHDNITSEAGEWQVNHPAAIKTHTHLTAVLFEIRSLQGLAVKYLTHELDTSNCPEWVFYFYYLAEHIQSQLKKLAQALEKVENFL